LPWTLLIAHTARMPFRLLALILFASAVLTPTSGAAKEPALEQNTNEGFYEAINRFGPPTRKSEHEAIRQDIWYYQDKILTFKEGILVRNVSTIESPFARRSGRRQTITAALPRISNETKSTAKVRNRIHSSQQTEIRAILEEIEKTVPSEAGSDSARSTMPRIDPRSGRGFQVAE